MGRRGRSGVGGPGLVALVCVSHSMENLTDRLGLAPETHWSAALLELSAQMPPVVLADVLGIAVATAEHWADLAGRDRTAYLSLSWRPPATSPRTACGTRTRHGCSPGAPTSRS
jgi:hypothetical protein